MHATHTQTTSPHRIASHIHHCIHHHCIQHHCIHHSQPITTEESDTTAYITHNQSRPRRATQPRRATPLPPLHTTPLHTSLTTHHNRGERPLLGRVHVHTPAASGITAQQLPFEPAAPPPLTTPTLPSPGLLSAQLPAQGRRTPAHACFATPSRAQRGACPLHCPWPSSMGSLPEVASSTRSAHALRMTGPSPTPDA